MFSLFVSIKKFVDILSKSLLLKTYLFIKFEKYEISTIKVDFGSIKLKHV